MGITIPGGAPVRTHPRTTAPVIHTLYHTIQSTMVVEPQGGNPRPWRTVVIKGLMTTRPLSKTVSGTNLKSGEGLIVLFSCYIDSYSNTHTHTHIYIYTHTMFYCNLRTYYLSINCVLRLARYNFKVSHCCHVCKSSQHDALSPYQTSGP